MAVFKRFFVLHQINYPRMANLALRGLTLGSKFLLMFILAKFLEPKDVGIYGLLVATIGYGVYFIGAEFYAFSTRELISANENERATILVNQFLVYLFWYVLCGPIIFCLGVYHLLPRGYLLWAFAVLVFEHVAQELNRILIALSQQQYAAIVLFVRMGLWAILVVITQLLIPASRTIIFVLFSWLCGCLVACCLALARLSKLVLWRQPKKISSTWITSGLKVALPFFLASIALKGMSTFDRYFVEELAGFDTLGAYALFAGVAAAVISFIDAGVVDFAYPKLVSAARSKDIKSFTYEIRKTRDNVVILGSLLVICAGLGGNFLVRLLGKSTYMQNISILYWLLFATTINFLSIIPHLGLYSLGNDRSIVQSQACGFIVFLLVLFIMPRSYGVISVLVSLCTGWTCVFLWKLTAYRAVFSGLEHRYNFQKF